MSAKDKSTIQAQIVNGTSLKVEIQNQASFASIYRNKQLSGNIVIDDTFIQEAKKSTKVFKPTLTDEVEPNLLNRLLMVFYLKFFTEMLDTVKVMQSVEFDLRLSLEGKITEYHFTFSRSETPAIEQFERTYTREILEWVVPVLAGKKLTLTEDGFSMLEGCKLNYCEVKNEPIKVSKPSRWERFLKAFRSFKFVS